MNPDRTSWGDSRLTDTVKRLDDRIDDLQNEVRANRDLPNAVVKLAEQMVFLRESVDQCRKGQEKLGDRFDFYVDAQDEMHENHRLERKSDRRWLVGTVLTSAALIIAAMGLILAHVHIA